MIGCVVLVLCIVLCTVSENESLKLSVCYGCVMVVLCIVLCTCSVDECVCDGGVLCCAVYLWGV